jgi:hypothetical protein
MKAGPHQLLQLGALMGQAHLTETLTTDPETAARAEGVQAGLLAAMVYLLPEGQVEAWCEQGDVSVPRIERLLQVARGLNNEGRKGAKRKTDHELQPA